jgi:hypothetical protein
MQAIDAFVNVLSCFLSHEALVQDVYDGWPIAGFYLEHLADQVTKLLAVHLVDRWVRSTENFYGKTIDGLGIESVTQVAHFV